MALRLNYLTAHSHIKIKFGYSPTNIMRHTINMPSDNENVTTLPMSLEEYGLPHTPVRVLSRRCLLGVIC